jgi:hypothetical protein
MLINRYQIDIVGDNLRLKPTINVAFRQSLDPPKSPLRRGTLRESSCPLLDPLKSPLRRETLNISCPPLIKGG